MRRRTAIQCLVFAVLVAACGDSREEPAAEGAAQPTAVADERQPRTDEPEQIGLTDAERKRLEKQYTAEALAQISAENAEAVGTRLLAEIQQELAVERAALDAGTE
jgi:hypothetical protein